MPTEATTPRGGGPSEEASAHIPAVDAGSSKGCNLDYGPTMRKRASATGKRGLFGSYGIIRKGHGYKPGRDAQHAWLRKRNFPCRKPSDIGIEVDSLREPVILDEMCGRTRNGSTDEGQGQDETLANDDFNDTLDELSTRLQKLTLESPKRHRHCSSSNEEASWRWLEVIGASAASSGPNTRPRAKDAEATPSTPPRARPAGGAEAEASGRAKDAEAIPRTPPRARPAGGAEAKAASAAAKPVTPRRPRSRNNRAAHSGGAPPERKVSSASTSEKGWRWMEVTDASSSSSKAAPTPKLRSTSRNQRPNKDAEDNWRYEELMGASSAPKSPPTEVAPSGSNSGPEVAAAKVAEEPIKEEEEPQLGDIVSLGAGAPPEFRQHSAVVSKVGEGFCTVIVLDESHRYGIGECWPGFDDMQLESSLLRLGTPVIIDGLQGRKTQHLNGFTGTIVSHPREGHPTFIRTKAAPDTPQFTTCIRLDHPPTAADRSVLLEPRFLFPRDTHLEQVTHDLGDMLKTLTDGAATATTATRGAAGG